MGARTLDIDILTYGHQTVDAPGLTIPHPRIAERAFVLVPLAEIAPTLEIAGRTVSCLVRQVDARGVNLDPIATDQLRRMAISFG